MTLAAAEIHSYNGTQDLDDGIWFAMFSTAWCAHCHDVQPAFTQAGNMSPLDYILIDCEQYKVFCKQRAVSRFPTFNYYDDSLVYSFEGGRTTQEFLEFVAKVQGPALQELQDLKSFQGLYEVSFTLLYNSAELKARFKELAEGYKHSHMHFAVLPSDNPELLVTGIDFNENYSTTALTLKNMQEFVELHSLPTLSSMDSAVLPKVTAYTRGKVLLVLVADLSDPDQAQVLVDFTSVAIKLRRNNSNIQACLLDHTTQAEQVEVYELDGLPAIIKTKVSAGSAKAVIQTGHLTKEIIEEVALVRPMEDISPSLKFRFSKMFGQTFSWKFVQRNSVYFYVSGFILVVGLFAGLFFRGDPDKED